MGTRSFSITYFYFWLTVVLSAPAMPQTHCPVDSISFKPIQAFAERKSTVYKHIILMTLLHIIYYILLLSLLLYKV